MTVTHYLSASKGLVEIASMHHAHAVNARDKLARELGADDHPRRAELDALNAHIATLEAEQEAEGQVNG